MAEIKITTKKYVDFKDLKDYALDAIVGRLEYEYDIYWSELSQETREEILENVLQEFSK